MENKIIDTLLRKNSETKINRGPSSRRKQLSRQRTERPKSGQSESNPPITKVQQQEKESTLFDVLRNDPDVAPLIPKGLTAEQEKRLERENKIRYIPSLRDHREMIENAGSLTEIFARLGKEKWRPAEIPIGKELSEEQLEKTAIGKYFKEVQAGKLPFPDGPSVLVAVEKARVLGDRYEDTPLGQMLSHNTDGEKPENIKPNRPYKNMSPFEQMGFEQGRRHGITPGEDAELVEQNKQEITRYYGLPEGTSLGIPDAYIESYVLGFPDTEEWTSTQLNGDERSEDHRVVMRTEGFAERDAETPSKNTAARHYFILGQSHDEREKSLAAA